MTFDESVVIARWWHPTEGDIVLDCGCASGDYTIPALERGAFVYAFDGDIKACQKLHMNIGTRFLGHYAVFNVGIYSEMKKKWSLVEAWETMGISREWTESVIGYQPIQFITIDSLTIPRIDWIKLDIEGFEYDALRGAAETLKNSHPKLIIENHINVDHIGPWMRANSVWAKILTLLDSYGYKVEEVGHHGRSHLYAS